MDWHTQFARSRGGGGGRISWAAGWAHSCIFQLLVVVKPLHFMKTRWVEKIRNSTERLSFSFSNTNKAEYRNPWRWLQNDPESAENVIFFVLFFLFFPLSILLQCTGCALNYYSMHHCCQNESMCVRFFFFSFFFFSVVVFLLHLTPVYRLFT